MTARKGTDTPRKRARTRARPPAPPPVNGHAENGFTTQLARDIKEEDTAWLCEPWFPRGMLSMLAGLPNTGKSTLLACLVAHVTGGPRLTPGDPGKPGHVLMLPSKEEPTATMTRPRLRVAGADLERVHFLRAPSIQFPRDVKKLVKIAASKQAELVLIDPIDSFMNDGTSENNATEVRPMLEALHGAAEQIGAAVICVRHPGKDENNIMPGSRAWRDVPRVIVELTTDGGIPPRFQIGLRKDGTGTGATPRRYELVGPKGEPKLFRFREELDATASDMTRTAAGPSGRYKLMQACRLVKWFFVQEDEPTRKSLGEEGRRQGLGEDTVNDALRLLAVRSVPPAEIGDPWRLVRTAEKWPSWLEDTVGG